MELEKKSLRQKCNCFLFYDAALSTQPSEKRVDGRPCIFEGTNLFLHVFFKSKIKLWFRE